ncbi:hypothetical protein ACFFMN_20535 [Planobispora siamensis]|uniref:hypothetical protein n=1 Tax=Planobispora siamensis TaxID=936338 RepID=UPI001EF25FCD|nr:hypothetical protein [Planobispora siamensis]
MTRADASGRVPAAGPPAALEIACDESGSEGEKLVGGNTDVFTHASVSLDVGDAAGCMREIRRRAPSPALEYKANILLRGKHRSALVWLLGPSGPLRGRTHVHLVDKTFFAVGRLAGLLTGSAVRPAGAGPRPERWAGDAGAVARVLYREGPEVFGPGRWAALLEAFNDLARAREPGEAAAHAEEFSRIVETARARPDGARGRADEIVGLLWEARSRAGSFRALLSAGPGTVPALDPLIPAIVRTVAHWTAGGRPVSIVHDMQTTLTEERIAQLREIPVAGGLTGLRLVDSRSDPRVQVADVLAGAARKIASEELNGRGDAELTALLRPYVDASSTWGDERSWSLLGPVADPPARPRP